MKKRNFISEFDIHNLCQYIENLKQVKGINKQYIDTILLSLNFLNKKLLDNYDVIYNNLLFWPSKSDEYKERVNNFRDRYIMHSISGEGLIKKHTGKFDSDISIYTGDRKIVTAKDVKSFLSSMYNEDELRGNFQDLVIELLEDFIIYLIDNEDIIIEYIYAMNLIDGNYTDYWKQLSKILNKVNKAIKQEIRNYRRKDKIWDDFVKETK